MPTPLNGKGQSVQAGSPEGQERSWPTLPTWEGTTRWIAWTHRAFLHYVSQMLFIFLTRVVHIMTLHWCESLGYVNAFNILVQWKQNIDNHVTHVMIAVRSLIWPRYSIAESALPMSNFWQTESTNVLKLLTIHVNDIQRSCWQPVELTFLIQFLRRWLT